MGGGVRLQGAGRRDECWSFPPREKGREELEVERELGTRATEKSL